MLKVQVKTTVGHLVVVSLNVNVVCFDRHSGMLLNVGVKRNSLISTYTSKNSH